MTAKNFLSIEALRAWMAWWVVIGHAIGVAGLPEWIPDSIEKLLSGGGIAVNVFIIVSGFVITHLLLVRRENYSTYLTRRWFRLFPVYFFCISLSILTESFYIYTFIDPAWNELREMRMDRIHEVDNNWTSHLLAHMSMLHGVIPDSLLKYSTSSILAPAWSISLEWQFYILAPLFILMLSKGINQAGLAISSLLFIWLISDSYISNQYQYPAMLFLSIQFFLVGIFSRLLIDHLSPLKISPTIAFLALLPIFLYFKSLEMIIWSLFYIFCLIECGVLYPKGANLNLRQQIWHWIMQAIALNPCIRYLGRISYSTYLVHIPTFGIVAYIYGDGSAIGEQREMLKALSIGMVACLAFSAALYHCIELPSIRAGSLFIKNTINRDKYSNPGNRYDPSI